MIDDDTGGGGKNGDFSMTSFVNDPLVNILLLRKGLYARYRCSRAHSAKRVRDDRVSCIQRKGAENVQISLSLSPAQCMIHQSESHFLSHKTLLSYV